MTDVCHELHAVDGEDLAELLHLVAPGGRLYVYNVSVFSTQPIVIGPDSPSLDMRNSVFVYGGDVLPALAFRNCGGTPHWIVDCFFDFLRTSPINLVRQDDDEDDDEETEA